MPALRAGSLNRRGLIQDQATTQGIYGEQSLAWVDVAAVWMSIEPLSGRELVMAQQINSEVTHLITIRYNPIFADPKTMAKRRIVYKGRIFNIHGSMNAEEGNNYIEILASEGLNNG